MNRAPKTRYCRHEAEQVPESEIIKDPEHGPVHVPLDGPAHTTMGSEVDLTTRSKCSDPDCMIEDWHQHTYTPSAGQWVSANPERATQNRTVEIARSVLETLVEHSSLSNEAAPGEAAAWVGARRAAKQALRT